MSLLDPTPASETSPASKQPQTQTQQARTYSDDQTHHSYSSSRRESYAESIYSEFYNMDEQGQRVEAPGPQKTQRNEEAPALPERSALRASRLLDGLGIMKLGAAMEATDLGATTPHDIYLSSEEEASSSADDFSRLRIRLEQRRHLVAVSGGSRGHGEDSVGGILGQALPRGTLAGSEVGDAQLDRISLADQLQLVQGNQILP